MNKKDLIQFCRYYAGEGENPYQGTDAMIWKYEKLWIDFTFEHNPTLADCINEYSIAGMSTFEMQDDTPASLKALLFNRFNQWDEGGDFKKWYKETYIKNQKRGS